jgi:hypothetical protein
VGSGGEVEVEMTGVDLLAECVESVERGCSVYPGRDGEFGFSVSPEVVQRMSVAKYMNDTC